LQKALNALAEDAEMGSSVAQGLDEVVRSIEDDDERAILRSWMETMTRSALAADPGALSLKHLDSDESFGGPDHTFPQGYDQIVGVLAQGVGVWLNWPVREIRHGRKGVLVMGERGSVEGDAVIVSVPLGVLQAETIRFDPPLPQGQREAIGRLGMGVLDKVVLRFDTPAWPEETRIIGLLNRGPALSPGFWVQPGAPGIITGFIGGGQARALALQSDEAIVDAVMAPLRKAYGRGLGSPKGVRITRWAQDPWARGSYSHVVAGHTPVDRVMASRALGGRVYFAGEATVTDYPATVHGALLSGRRAAEEVMEIFD